jgi:hypothetical protein
MSAPSDRLPSALGLLRASGPLAPAHVARVRALLSSGVATWGRSYCDWTEPRECVLFGVADGAVGAPDWHDGELPVDVYDDVLTVQPEGAAEKFFTGGPISLNTFDIDPTREDAMNRWYVAEHIPNLLTVPGYRNAVRYHTDRPAARAYLTLYELASPRYMESIGPTEKQSPEAAAELASFMRDWDRYTIELSWEICLPVEEWHG